MRGLRLALPLAGFAVSLACSGGGGGGGGVIVNNTAASQGAITEIGSARVAGTLWNTSAVPAQVIFDETQAGDPSQLFPGMFVRVQGQLDGASPDQGTASAVLVYDAVEGPVTSVTDIDADRAELVVVGRTVVALRDQTYFGGAMGFDFDSMAANDVVEVWGQLDGDVVRATRIEKTGDFAGGNPPVEITGEITNVDVSDPNGGTFELVGCSFEPVPTPCTVVYDHIDDNNTDLKGVPGGEATLLLPGKIFGVKGVLDMVGDEIIANEVHLRGPLTSDIPDFEVDGIVTDFVDLGSAFRVGGQPVLLSVVTSFEPPSLESSPAVDFHGLANGMQVEVEGQLTAGTLMADVVRFRSEEAFIAAQIEDGTAIDPGAGTVELLQGITVVVDDDTILEDETSAAPLSLTVLDSGDYLEVRGIDLDGEVLATRLVRKSAVGNIVVRGRVESFDFVGPPVGEFTMLGLDPLTAVQPIPTDAGTTFSEFPGGVATETAFYNFLFANPGALIEVTDSTGSAAAIDVANHIEYEDE